MPYTIRFTGPKIGTLYATQFFILLEDLSREVRAIFILLYRSGTPLKIERSKRKKKDV
nr:hypothetical protein [Leptospira interrogans]